MYYVHLNVSIHIFFYEMRNIVSSDENTTNILISSNTQNLIHFLPNIIEKDVIFVNTCINQRNRKTVLQEDFLANVKKVCPLRNKHSQAAKLVNMLCILYKYTHSKRQENKIEHIYKGSYSYNQG